MNSESLPGLYFLGNREINRWRPLSRVRQAHPHPPLFREGEREIDGGLISRAPYRVLRVEPANASLAAKRICQIVYVIISN